MREKTVDDYYNQFSLFEKHLGQEKLAGVIIGKKCAENVVLDATSYHKLKLSKDENLYFVPQVCEAYGEESCIKSIRTLFLDVDELSEKSRQFKTQTDCSLFIERSDGKAFQAFLFLDFEATPEEFRDYQHRLAIKFGGDVSIKNPNRLARVAGFIRGEKKKDKKKGIAENLFYKSDYHVEGKLFSRADINKLVLDVKPEDTYDKTTGEVFKPVNSFPEFEELERDFSTEEGIFYTYFLNKTKGSGTSTILFRFGCFLLDRAMNLVDFESWALKKEIDIYTISCCDSEEWETIASNVQKYAKNQKKLAKKEEALETIQTTVLQNKNLFEMYPFLQDAMTDINNYVFVEDEDKFFRQEDEKLVPISKSIFASTFSRYFLKVNKKGVAKKINPIDTILAKENRSHFKIVSSKLYMPHMPKTHNRCLNTWSYPILSSPVGGSTDIFINHIKFLFNDQKTHAGDDLAGLFLDFLTYAYLNKTPPTYGYLLYAEKMGLGRSFLVAVMDKLMGDNVSTPSDRIAREHYTGWHSTKQLAVIEELGEDRSFFEQLKPVIGNKKVSHRQMNKDAITVDNHCSIIMLTNKVKALNIAKGDRRIVVCHMHQEVKEPAYYTALYNWAEKPENIAALSEYFKTRYETIDKAKMNGHAPMTDAKLLTQRLVTDSETQNIEECLAEISFGEQDEFICQRMLIERLYPNVTDAIVRYRGFIASKLSELGYSLLVVGKSVRIDGGVKAVTLYVKTSLATKHSKDLVKVVEIYREFLKCGKKIVEPVVEPVVKEKSKLQQIVENLLAEKESEKEVEKPKKTKAKKAESVHKNIEKARKLHEKELETGIAHTQEHTCADLIKIRDNFIKKDFEPDFLEIK